MSVRYTARTPGKLFLLGEYAVLDGCPAVVAAIGPGIEAMASRGAGSAARSGAAAICITSERFGTVRFAGSQPPPLDGPLRFAIAAYCSVARRLPPFLDRDLTIAISDRREVLSEASVKVGLGSSAAVTAGVVAALYAAAGCDPAHADVRRELLAAAVEAHRAAQGGAGSGADVAACVHGGIALIETCPEGLPVVTPRRLPAGVHLLVGWSGAAASTVGLVHRYREAAGRARAAHAAFVAAMRACVARFVGSLDAGTVSLAALDDAGRLLERLADGFDLPLLTPRLRALLAIARAHGAAAKISGAGGGDCGIALSPDPLAAERIRTDWRAAGIAPLNPAIGVQGVTVGSA